MDQNSRKDLLGNLWGLELNDSRDSRWAAYFQYLSEEIGDNVGETTYVIRLIKKNVTATKKMLKTLLDDIHYGRDDLGLATALEVYDLDTRFPDGDIRRTIQRADFNADEALSTAV